MCFLMELLNGKEKISSSEVYDIICSGVSEPY